MKKNPLVSIILRSYNEERWIGLCLDAIMSQRYKNFEIILVDNNSSDLTVSKTKQYPVKIINIDKFKPGLALNMGIRESKGEILVCLSSHCIPTNELWLTNLIKEFDNNEKYAAIYGRQEPMSFTTDMDKRDLLTVFGLDKKIQWKDSFFHNANSAIRRELWEKIPFDEEISNIEDRLWAREIIKLGYGIVYEPDASVYHWHGIHQNQEPERCANVVRIIEGLYSEDQSLYQYKQVDNVKSMALIPVKGDILKLNGKSLLAITVEALRKSKRITSIAVTTDSDEYVSLAKELGVDHVIIRGHHLAKDFVDLMVVYQDAIRQMEEKGVVPDVIVPIEITFPFRDANLIDQLIHELVTSGHEVVVPSIAEYGACWKKNERKLDLLSDGFVPRKFKEPVWVGIKGLGMATFPGRILKGNLFSSKVKIYEVKNHLSHIEVRTQDDIDKLGKILSLLGI